MATSSLLDMTKQYAMRVDYYRDAKKLKLTDKEVIQRAADDYCDAVDAGNETGKDKFMAVLMMKFWYQLANMQRKCKAEKLMEYGDFYSHLYYCIETAMGYRAWRDTSKKTNAQACINSAISSRGAAEILYSSNLDKHKANINTASLDTPLNGGDSDDKETTLADVLPDSKLATQLTGAAGVVQLYIDEGNLVEAIIIDNLSFGDSTRTTKDKNTDDRFIESWDYRVVRLLNSLDEDYFDGFASKYTVGTLELTAARNSIANMSNQKLYKEIDNTKLHLRAKYNAGTIGI